MMSWFANLSSGTLPQWGTFVTLLGILAGVLTVFIRGWPDRLRAHTEGRKLDGDQFTLLTDQYAKQVGEYRTEVHLLRNELQAAAGIHRKEVWAITNRLNTSEAASRERGDTIRHMSFVIDRLIAEQRKIDPGSAIIKEMEGMMAHMLRKQNGPTADSDNKAGDAT